MKKKFLIVSIVAALLGCISDVLLLYSASGNYHTGDLNFFDSISLNRINMGFFIGILFIPFEILGLSIIGEELYPEKSTKRKLFQFLLEYLFILGLIYHGIISIMGIVKKEATNANYVIELCNALHDPLVLILGIGFVLLSFCIISPVLKGCRLPKKLLLFNPVMVYAILLVLYLLLPSIGNWTIVAGFNLSIFVFLLAAFITVEDEVWNE